MSAFVARKSADKATLARGSVGARNCQILRSVCIEILKTPRKITRMECARSLIVVILRYAVRAYIRRHDVVQRALRTTNAKSKNYAVREYSRRHRAVQQVLRTTKAKNKTLVHGGMGEKEKKERHIYKKTHTRALLRAIFPNFLLLLILSLRATTAHATRATCKDLKTLDQCTGLVALFQDIDTYGIEGIHGKCMTNRVDGADYFLSPRHKVICSGDNTLTIIKIGKGFPFRSEGALSEDLRVLFHAQDTDMVTETPYFVLDQHLFNQIRLTVPHIDNYVLGKGDIRTLQPQGANDNKETVPNQMESVLKFFVADSTSFPSTATTEEQTDWLLQNVITGSNRDYWKLIGFDIALPSTPTLLDSNNYLTSLVTFVHNQHAQLQSAYKTMQTRSDVFTNVPTTVVIKHDVKLTTHEQFMQEVADLKHFFTNFRGSSSHDNSPTQVVQWRIDEKKTFVAALKNLDNSNQHVTQDDLPLFDGLLAWMSTTLASMFSWNLWQRDSAEVTSIYDSISACMSKLNWESIGRALASNLFGSNVGDLLFNAILSISGVATAFGMIYEGVTSGKEKTQPVTKEDLTRALLLATCRAEQTEVPGSRPHVSDAIGVDLGAAAFARSQEDNSVTEKKVGETIDNKTNTDTNNNDKTSSNQGDSATNDIGAETQEDDNASETAMSSAPPELHKSPVAVSPADVVVPIKDSRKESSSAHLSAPQPVVKASVHDSAKTHTHLKELDTPYMLPHRKLVTSASVFGDSANTPRQKETSDLPGISLRAELPGPYTHLFLF